MLANIGYDFDKLEEKLSSIEIKAPVVSPEQFYDYDIDGYLSHQHESLLFSVIDEAKKDVC